MELVWADTKGRTGRTKSWNGFLSLEMTLLSIEVTLAEMRSSAVLLSGRDFLIDEVANEVARAQTLLVGRHGHPDVQAACGRQHGDEPIASFWTLAGNDFCNLQKFGNAVFALSLQIQNVHGTDANRLHEKRIDMTTLGWTEVDGCRQFWLVRRGSKCGDEIGVLTQFG